MSKKKDIDEKSIDADGVDPIKMAKGGRANWSKHAKAGDKAARQRQGASEAQAVANTVAQPIAAANSYTEPQDAGGDEILNFLGRKKQAPTPLVPAEKQHYPPCLNPSCKSFGKSHPNCTCYGGVPEAGMFAEGGDATSFCSQNRCHEAGCEYYADGGDSIPEDAIPVEQFQADTNSAIPADNTTAQNPQDSTPEGSIPVDQFKADAGPEGAIPVEQFQADSDKYDTTGQKILTGVEGAAQGFAGPVATLAEKGLSKLGVPGLSDEEIKGRAAENPWIHGGAEAAGLGVGLLTGTGEAGLILKGAEAATNATKLGKVGSLIFKAAVENGAIQAGDEISKAMLGQDSPEGREGAVASSIVNIGASALIGGLTGGIASGAAVGAGRAANKTLQMLEDSKLGNKLNSFLVGAGKESFEKSLGNLNGSAINADTAKLLGLDWKSLELGRKSVDVIRGQGTRIATDTMASVVGHTIGGFPGALAATALNEKIIRPLVGKAFDKYSVPTIIKILSSGMTDATETGMSHARSVMKGSKLIKNSIDNLFSASKVAGQQSYNAYAQDKNREKLRKQIEEGGVTQQIQNEINSSNTQPQSFAEGGQVAPPTIEQPNHLAQLYPTQDMMMTTAKGRVSGYLNSIRPQEKAQGLPFDEEMKNPESEKSYDRALDIANSPLSVLDHVKNGTLEAEHMKHLTQMYPEVYSHLSKKITERISEDQLKGEKPSYKVRQGLSLFLGAPLDSTFTPQAIQAVQNVFATQKAAQQAASAMKPKKNTSNLSKLADNARTPDQAREERQSKA